MSLPYHHPLITADRITQLDLQTRGRLIVGTGPGKIPLEIIEVQNGRYLEEDDIVRFEEIYGKC